MRSVSESPGPFVPYPNIELWGCLTSRYVFLVTYGRSAPSTTLLGKPGKGSQPQSTHTQKKQKNFRSQGVEVLLLKHDVLPAHAQLWDRLFIMRMNTCETKRLTQALWSPCGQKHREPDRKGVNNVLVYRPALGRCWNKVRTRGCQPTMELRGCSSSQAPPIAETA